MGKGQLNGAMKRGRRERERERVISFFSYEASTSRHSFEESRRVHLRSSGIRRVNSLLKGRGKQKEAKKEKRRTKKEKKERNKYRKKEEDREGKEREESSTFPNRHQS